MVKGTENKYFSENAVEGRESSSSNNLATSQKKFNGGVKETHKQHPKTREVLRKIMFVEREYTYATLVRKLEENGVRTTRQYLYGILTGRLTPSYAFACDLARALEVKVHTLFDMSELHVPEFTPADQLKEVRGDTNGS